MIVDVRNCQIDNMMVVPPMPFKAYSTIASSDINSTFLGMTHPGSHLQVISANRADLDCTVP